MQVQMQGATAPADGRTAQSDPVAGGTPHWEQQQRHLWVGRLDGRPIGTIERGRRYTLIGGDGEVVRRCTTLAEAQASFEGGTADGASAARRQQRRLLLASTAATFSTSAFTLTALLVR